MYINKTITTCGAYPYCTSIGECSLDKKCSYTLTYTKNNTDKNMVVTPVPYIDRNIIIINKI